MKAAAQRGMDLIKNNFEKDIKDPISLKNTYKVEILIQKAIRDGINKTELLNIVLLVAFECEQSEMIEYMLNKDAEINAKRASDLRTPIFLAAERGNLNWFVKVFGKLSKENKLKLINARDANEETPLFLVLAQDKPDPELIEFFIKNDANIKIINRQGQSLVNILEHKIYNTSDVEIKNKLVELFKYIKNILSNEKIDEKNIGNLKFSSESHFNRDSDDSLSEEELTIIYQNHSSTSHVFGILGGIADSTENINENQDEGLFKID